MSTIGKIFLVLNLVLAGAFVGYASLSVGRAAELKKQNAEAIARLQAEKDKLDKDLAEALASANTERTTKDEVTSQRNNLQAEKTRLEQDLDRAREENARNGGTLKTLTESVAEFSGKLEKIAQEKDQALAAKESAALKAQEADQRAQAAELAQREAEESKTRADRDIADLSKALASSKKDVSALQVKYDSLKRFTGVAESDITSQNPIDAVVAHADYSSGVGLIQLNRGKDDGVAQGYVFDVWQGSTYKGQVKIDMVYKNSCAGTVQHAKAGVQITAGDSASTHL